MFQDPDIHEFNDQFIKAYYLDRAKKKEAKENGINLAEPDVTYVFSSIKADHQKDIHKMRAKLLKLRNQALVKIDKYINNTFQDL